MKEVFLAVLVSSLVVGCNVADDGDAHDGDRPTQPRVADIAKSYKTLQSMTKEPVFVNPELAALCRGATQQEVENAQKESGPHANTEVMIYMSDSAAATFRKGTGAYPVGSIIVKEKKGMGYWPKNKEDGPRAKTPDGVGGMIKRAPGFDTDHGDWEYFYFADPSKIETGKIASCVKCHAGAAQKDYVFGSWAKG